MQANQKATTSRRALLASVPAMAMSSAVASPALAPTEPNPDAELIRWTADATAVPEPMRVAHPDADLLAACAALVAADTERRRVWAEADGTDAGVARVEAAAEPLGEEIVARAREIAGLPATTWEGQAAKARAASLIAPRRSNGAIISDGMTDDLVWSLVADLAGRA